MKVLNIYKLNIYQVLTFMFKIYLFIYLIIYLKLTKLQKYSIHIYIKVARQIG